MHKATRSARIFVVEGTTIPVDHAKHIATFHRDFLVTLNLQDSTEMTKYLSKFAQDFNLHNGQNQRYFWAYTLDGPIGVDLFGYTPLEHLKSDTHQSRVQESRLILRDMMRFTGSEPEHI